MNEASNAIIGGAFQVESRLGFGFLERIYRNALVHVLQEAGVTVKAEVPIKVLWTPGVVLGTYQADLVVEGALIVEIKTVERLHDAHRAQLLNYLKGTGLTLGLLLNFGPRGLEKRRVVNAFVDGPLPYLRESA